MIINSKRGGAFRIPWKIVQTQQTALLHNHNGLTDAFKNSYWIGGLSLRLGSYKNLLRQGQVILYSVHWI